MTGLLRFQKVKIIRERGLGGEGERERTINVLNVYIKEKGDG